MKTKMKVEKSASMLAKSSIRSFRGAAQRGAVKQELVRLGYPVDDRGGYANLCRLLREKVSAKSPACDFKPEIDSKEAIRDAVGEVDAKGITQLERWWDKYRVSLSELDAQVAEAESVMKGYLQELGYE